MFFFFKKKSLVLDCFTAIKTAYDFAKPDHAAKFIPEWWKELPPTYVEEGKFFPAPTLKTCKGITGLYSRGMILPSWCDICVEVDRLGSDEYRWQFSDHHHNASIHEAMQFGTHFNSTKIAHLKLNSPWMIKAADAVPFMLCDPVWNTIYNFNYKVLTGVLDFKYQHSNNVNVLFNRKPEKYVENIPYKTPLALFTPIDADLKLKFKYHLVSEEEFARLYTPTVTFTNIYKTNKRMKCGRG